MFLELLGCKLNDQVDMKKVGTIYQGALDTAIGYKEDRIFQQNLKNRK